jgi:hypothetical protein
MSDAGVKQRGDQHRPSRDNGGAPRVSVKKGNEATSTGPAATTEVRREGTLTLPSPAHDRGRGHEKNEREKRAERRRECR